MDGCSPVEEGLFPTCVGMSRDLNFGGFHLSPVPHMRGDEPEPDLFLDGDDPTDTLIRRRDIPIGNLTSQFFANLYLNGLDHFLKEELRCRHYLRCMDDLVALDDDKGWLHWVKEEIVQYMAGLRLRPHQKKCRVFSVREGIELLGYRVYPDHRRLRRNNDQNNARSANRNRNEPDDVRLEIASRIGAASALQRIPFPFSGAGGRPERP